MKTKLTLSLVFLIQLNIYSQFGAQQIITTDIDAPRSVYAIDIDGDGDVDILSGSASDGKVAWYENTDGQGSFGPQRIITTNTIFTEFVYSSDIDGDGDMDVLSASKNDNKIAWYENIDGLGNFGTQQIITSNANSARGVHSADLDGDGDLDVLSASALDDTIAWYENTDGQGNFGAQQIISTDADEAISVYPSDIDNDGDIDVLSASTRDDKIAWYENTDGLGNFSSQKIITTNADGAKYVFAVDIDGDGDSDVLSASAFDNKIAWYENTDGQGNFSSQQIISTTTEFAKFVYSADLDNDGDKDVLAAAFGENKVTWFENTDGLGNFGTEQIITTETINPNSVFATDLNGDDSVDVLYASQTDDKIAWQENMGTLSINQNKVLAFSAYPVPVENILTLNSKNIITQVEIYNVFGQHYSLSFDQNKIDMSKLTQGMYLIKMLTKLTQGMYLIKCKWRLWYKKDSNGDYGIKKILKK